MPTSILQKAAAQLCEELYVRHDKLLATAPGFESFCRMTEQLVADLVPLSWPGVEAETLHAISVGIPLINASGVNRVSDTKIIEGVLRAHLTPQKAPPKKRQVRKKSSSVNR